MPITSRISRNEYTGEVDLENQLIKLTLYFTDSAINITGYEVLISHLMIDLSWGMTAWWLVNRLLVRRRWKLQAPPTCTNCLPFNAHHIPGNVIQISIAADTNVVSYFGKASIIKFFKNVYRPFILNISDEILKLTLPIPLLNRTLPMDTLN